MALALLYQGAHRRTMLARERGRLGWVGWVGWGLSFWVVVGKEERGGRGIFFDVEKRQRF